MTSDANHKLTNDHAAMVDTSYHWIPISEIRPPMGAKLQLINKANGVAVYSNWTPNGYWTHWQALPTFKKEHK
jgi:hypothetical protein